jgi:putative nucleotidyltransferase with HDIG domain
MVINDATGEHRARILIVDDESSILRILARILTFEGYDCHTAQSVDTALESLHSVNPEVVISDIRMPERDGTELLLELHSKHPDIAVIMLTGHGDVDLAVRCLHDGASDFLTKPVRGAHLATSVERALERRQLILENHAYARELEQRVQSATQDLNQTLADLNEAYDMTLGALSSAIDAREADTGDHSRRVTRISTALSQHLGLSAPDQVQLSRGALLHDIGKIGIPDSILLKPGKLTDAEMAVMRRHPEIGYQILKPIPFLKDAAVIVYQHHEYFDGSGYPAGISGRDIRWGARIFAVADALDAMTSDRPYRKAIGLDDALAELERCSGTQFDPEIISGLNSLGRVRIASLINQ